MVQRVVEVGKQVIACRQRNHHVIKMLGGRGVHPVAGLPGGWSKAVSEEERQEIEGIADENIEFALFSLQVFADIVLASLLLVLAAPILAVFGASVLAAGFDLGAVAMIGGVGPLLEEAAKAISTLTVEKTIQQGGYDRDEILGEGGGERLLMFLWDGDEGGELA